MPDPVTGEPELNGQNVVQNEVGWSALDGEVGEQRLFKDGGEPSNFGSQAELAKNSDDNFNLDGGAIVAPGRRSRARAARRAAATASTAAKDEHPELPAGKDKGVMSEAAEGFDRPGGVRSPVVDAQAADIRTGELERRAKLIKAIETVKSIRRQRELELHRMQEEYPHEYGQVMAAMAAANAAAA